MKKIEWYYTTGYAGEIHQDTFEVDDSATDEEIDEIVREQVFNYIDWGWKVKVKENE